MTQPNTTEAATLDAGLQMVRDIAEWSFPDADISIDQVTMVLQALATSTRPEFRRFRGSGHCPAVRSEIARGGAACPAMPMRGSVRREVLEAALLQCKTHNSQIAGVEIVAKDELQLGPVIDYTTYSAHATHLRTSPIYSCFDGPMQAVRVALGQTHTPTFHTPLGQVFAFDHLMFSVADVAEKYGAQVGKPFQRVELVTGARRDLLRFSPVSLYFGYETEDSPLPFFFVLEAATVFGTPKVLYLGTTMDSVLFYHVGYTPTPFSNPDYYYRSTLSMDGNDPDTLIIEASETPTSKPYITITMIYQRDAEPPAPIFAGEQIGEAILRVAGIAKGLGYDLNFIEQWFANQGLDDLPWLLNPENNLPES